MLTLRSPCARQRPLCSSWASPDDPVQSRHPTIAGMRSGCRSLQPQSIRCQPCAVGPQVTPAPCSHHRLLWSGPQGTSTGPLPPQQPSDTWRWRRSSPRPPPSVRSSLLFNSKVVGSLFHPEDHLLTMDTKEQT